MLSLAPAYRFHLLHTHVIVVLVVSGMELAVTQACTLGYHALAQPHSHYTKHEYFTNQSFLRLHEEAVVEKRCTAQADVALHEDVL
jgi:D-aminopeptidase